jgi:predicted ATPase/DNA-binding CsgD family transcriptional regulator
LVEINTAEELSPRELDVLAAVGRRLSNAEIAAELFISVRTVESHIAALRRKLGVDSRADLIAAAIRRQRRITTVVHRPQNSFVGRHDELATLGELLRRDRWVTVVGPAGCGKTRLALETAAGAGQAAVVVELEHVATDTTGAVARAVAAALGLAVEGGADLVAVSARALEAEPHLLVLDDCDRVTAGATDVVRDLLVRSPDLVVLATSRSPLGASDETTYPIDPLPVGDDATSAAVQLFLDRGRAAAPTTEPSDADLAAAARICRQLDGLPLAIELAAARVRHLPVTELADLLGDGLQVLDRAGPPSRHRTLEAAFAWTWDLLDADERLVLSQLAALPRPFDLPLADAVTRPGVAAVVMRLLDRSLLAHTAGPGDPRRFRLLESLRAFVLDRADPGVVEAVHLAHAEHHAGRIGDIAHRVRTDDRQALVEEAKRLTPDVAAALDWAIGADPALAVSLARSQGIVVSHSGPDVVSLAAIARASHDPGVRAAATVPDLFEIGQALFYSELVLLDDLVEHMMSVARDDTDHLAVHHLAGWADAYRDRPTAVEHLAAAEQLAIDLGDAWQLASIRQAQGVVHLRSHPEDTSGAYARFQAAAETYALAGDVMHVNNCRYMMASAAVAAGRYDDAATLLDQCAAHAQAVGNDHEQAHVTLTRARFEPDGDDNSIHQAIAVFRASGDLRCITRSFLLLADRRSHPGRQHWLAQALAVALDADDHSHQVTALEGLVTAHWDTEESERAAQAWGALAALVGDESARDHAPAGLRAALPALSTAYEVGRRRGYAGA